MTKISGTNVLLYYNGKAVSLQRGLNISVNDTLIDASSKDSAGWWEGIPGLKDAKVSFTSLFSTGLMTDTPAVLGAKDLANYLINKDRLLVTINDLGYTIIGEAYKDGISFDAPAEQAVFLSGSIKITGKLYLLAGTLANLITDPDGNTSDYDTLTVSDLSITSAVKSSAGAKKCDSNTISVADTGVYKLAVYLTSNSGQCPTVGLWDNTSAYISNTQALVAGLNFITLTCTSTDASASLRFSNSANGNWSLSPLYLFRVS
jgi:hypothetical protein